MTFLGSGKAQNTFCPSDGRPRGWLFKYLHQRFYRLSDRGVETFVRVPSGDEPIGRSPGPRPTIVSAGRVENRSTSRRCEVLRPFGTTPPTDRARDIGEASRFLEMRRLTSRRLESIGGSCRMAREVTSRRGLPAAAALRSFSRMSFTTGGLAIRQTPISRAWAYFSGRTGSDWFLSPSERPSPRISLEPMCWWEGPRSLSQRRG